MLICIYSTKVPTQCNFDIFCACPNIKHKQLLTNVSYCLCRSFPQHLCNGQAWFFWSFSGGNDCPHTTIKNDGRLIARLLKHLRRKLTFWKNIKSCYTILSSSDVPTSLQPSCSRKDAKFFVSPAGTQYLTFIQKTSVLNIRFLVCRRYKILGV